MKRSGKNNSHVGSDVDAHLEEGLKDAELAAAFINAALEENDETYLPVALGKVARAHGMGKVSDVSGIGREALYKMLSSDGNPGLANIIQILKACGLSISVQSTDEIAGSAYVAREPVRLYNAKRSKKAAPKVRAAGLPARAMKKSRQIKRKFFFHRSPTSEGFPFGRRVGVGFSKRDLPQA